MVPIYSGDSQNLLVWLLQDTRSLGQVQPAISNDTINITGFPIGNYQITWYESTTGNVVASTSVTNTTSIVEVIPTFVRDIVAIVKPE